MPELFLLNEQFAAHMSRLSEDAAEISEYLRGEVQKILKKHMKEKNGNCLWFDLEGFFDYPPILQKQVMFTLLGGAAKAGGGTDRKENLSALWSNRRKNIRSASAASEGGKTGKEGRACPDSPGICSG